MSSAALQIFSPKPAERPAAPPTRADDPRASETETSGRAFEDTLSERKRDGMDAPKADRKDAPDGRTRKATSTDDETARRTDAPAEPDTTLPDAVLFAENLSGPADTPVADNAKIRPEAGQTDKTATPPAPSITDTPDITAAIPDTGVAASTNGILEAKAAGTGTAETVAETSRALPTATAPTLSEAMSEATSETAKSTDAPGRNLVSDGDAAASLGADAGAGTGGNADSDSREAEPKLSKTVSSGPNMEGEPPATDRASADRTSTDRSSVDRSAPDGPTRQTISMHAPLDSVRIADLAVEPGKVPLGNRIAADAALPQMASTAASSTLTSSTLAPVSGISDRLAASILQSLPATPQAVSLDKVPQAVVAVALTSRSATLQIDPPELGRIRLDYQFDVQGRT
ncbi:MAG: hypothetical protein WBA35_05820, partial [Litorimonas sp.]